MTLHSMKQCAMQEIHGLQNHDSAEEAMKVFCRLAVGTGPGPGFTHMNTKYIYSFYIFSQPIHPTDKTSQLYRPYGPKFAKFITDNGLGKVMETDEVKNWAFHEQHSNKFWIWIPDQDAVMKWWKDKKPKETYVAPPLPVGWYVPEPVNYGSDDD
jgi:hypothetical protein